MSEYVLELRNAIKKAAPLLRNIGDQASRKPPRPRKWSPREVIGHLIDSASNNHQRFVRVLFQDDLVFPGYDQDAWVTVQAYQGAPWNDLIELCMLFNLQIARLMEAIPEHERRKQRARHNLDVLAWKTIPPPRTARDARLFHG